MGINRPNGEKMIVVGDYEVGVATHRGLQGISDRPGRLS